MLFVPPTEDGGMEIDMKKLYERIEDIYIKGGIEQLSEIVTVMDSSMQNIAAYTDKLVDSLVVFNNSNMGKQYDNVVSNSLRLRDEVFDRAYELNDMQNQIIAYQNKIYKYEGMSEHAEKANPFLAVKKPLSINNTGVRFNRTDMMDLANVLKSYSEAVARQISIIKNKKNDIESIWLDSQYYDFAEFIESIIRKIKSSIKIFDDFVVELEERIERLN